VHSAELLLDAFGRVRGVAVAVVDGLDPERLAWRPDPGANSIGWLVWHLTRIQNDHLADAFGVEQVWTSGGWAGRFGLPFDVAATGYGASPDDVAAVRAGADDLAGYHGAVHDRTVDLVRGTTADDLDRVVDADWDPPVTLGTRLVSVLGDGWQHAGQAAYLRGLLQRGGM